MGALGDLLVVCDAGVEVCELGAMIERFRGAGWVV